MNSQLHPLCGEKLRTTSEPHFFVDCRKIEIEVKMRLDIYHCTGNFIAERRVGSHVKRGHPELEASET